MNKKCKVYNSATINYHTSSTSKKSSVSTNTVETLIYDNILCINSCYRAYCSHNKYIKFNNLFYFYNHNDFPLYDLKFELIIPPYLKYCNNNFQLRKDRNKCECIPLPIYYLQHMPPNCNYTIAFNTMTNQPPHCISLLSYILITFHYFDPSGNYITQTIKNEIFLNRRV